MDTISTQESLKVGPPPAPHHGDVLGIWICRNCGLIVDPAASPCCPGVAPSLVDARTVRMHDGLVIAAGEDLK